ncbi:12004_t:CDS:2 [Ambispora gerdemannii]|uniref:12004_t:CDS:1 n=1 Tax=Ambispora gerdemannii TaxID=144530 RepID=A0A9N8VWY8_9GLOM|nr:12004_t:CDS:2 [Ambispora gerdemannii]
MCQFIPVNCNEHEDHPHCKEVFLRKEIEKHRQECTFKMMACPLKCPKKFSKMEEVKEHCEEDCINRKVTCNRCKVTILCYQLDDHDTICLGKIIKCPHRNILGSFGGCTEEFERKQLSEHLKTCKFEPFKEAFRGINMYMMTLERKIELIQQEYKEELSTLSTLRLCAADVRSTEQLRNILKYNPAVRSLHLIDFQPGPHCLMLMDVMMANETVESINLRGSEIEKTGAVLLGKALKNNHTVQTLILADNSIGDQGVEYLSKSLESNKTLRYLDLAGNNIGDKGMERFCRFLTSNFTIEQLDLSWNNIRSKSVENLIPVLEHKRCNIRILELGNNEIGYKGAESIAKTLEVNQSLISLDLDHTKIGTKGCEAIAKALEKNNTLQKLILAENYIEDRGAEVLADGLLLNSSISIVDLEGNMIGDVGANNIVKAMDKSAALAFAQSREFGNMMRTIYLRRNQISRIGLRNATKFVKYVRVISDRGEK